MKFTFDEIVKATGAEVLECKNSSGTFNLSTDTRKIKIHDIYLPLKGEKFDGHDFIKNALDEGASGYFTSDKKLIFPNAAFVLYTEDTLEAYLKLALYYKKIVNPITIAVTGSSGKTTTKEMTASVVSEKFKTHKSILNHNNEIGLCQTMLSMPEDTEVLVVEMGMRGPGEIELLSKYAEPDIAIIANTGTAHVGRLGSVENIAKAKCEITKHLHIEGLLLAHDTELIRKTNTYTGQTVYLGLDSKDLTDVKLKTRSSEFVYKNQKYELNAEGEHNIQNSLFAINAGLKLGMSSDEIAVGLAKYKSIEKRWEIHKINGFNIIDDSYNSNPDSLRAAISTFLSTHKPPRALVLGDMKELGEDEILYHRKIGEFLESFSDFELITVGKLGKWINKGLGLQKRLQAENFDTNKETAKYILENLPAGTTILFKASHSMNFDEIIKELKKK